ELMSFGIDPNLPALPKFHHLPEERKFRLGDFGDRLKAEHQAILSINYFRRVLLEIVGQPALKPECFSPSSREWQFDQRKRLPAWGAALGHGWTRLGKYQLFIHSTVRL